MTDTSYYDYHGWIRRIDVSLRTHYPNLVTRIFEIAPSQYVIVFDKELRDADAIRGFFDANIRFMTTNASVANDIPAQYLREIAPLTDDHLSMGFAGVPFNHSELFNLVLARFPKLPIVGVRGGGTPMRITVELTEEIDGPSKEELLEFCRGLEFPVPWEVIVTGRIMKAHTLPIPGALMPMNDALSVRATRLRAGMPDYVRRDETYWFEAIDKVYAGTLSVKDIPGVEQNQSQCFIDLTVGNHINLRQAVMLYDTVYCSPPLAEGHESLLHTQRLTDEDLLYLIEKDRLKIVSTQAEERLNLQFLAAAVERHPTAIIGRRMTAALLIADLVQMAEEYRFARPGLEPAVGELAKLLSAKSKIPADELLRLIMWPVEARRASLQPLLDRGSKGIAPIGLGPFLSRRIKQLLDKDVELEALVASERLHIGHALNATVFPSRDEPSAIPTLTNLMGDQLNFFRSFNTRIAASWAANEDRKAARKTIMPSIPLFEFEPSVPIREFLESVRLASTREKGRALFGRIAELPEERRSAEVSTLEADLRKYSTSSTSFISFENFDTAASIGGLLFGVLYPPLAGLRTIGAQIVEAARAVPIVDKMVHDIEKDLFSALGKNQEIDFLSRINRVATFKKDRIS